MPRCHEEFNKTPYVIKQKIFFFISSNYKLDFVQLLADSANGNVYILTDSVQLISSHQRKESLSAETPILFVHNATGEECDLFTCDTEGCLPNVQVTLGVLRHGQKHVKRTFYFAEMEADGFLRQVCTNTLKLKCGTGRLSFSNLGIG